MTYKLNILTRIMMVMFTAYISFFFISENIVFAEELDKEVLILYEERNFFGDSRDSVSAIEDLLGHYKAKVYVEKLSKTKKYDFKKYDLILVIALDRDLDYPNMNESLNEYENKIIWLGNGIERFLNTNEYPLAFDEEEFNLKSVSYRRQGTGDLKTFSLGEKRGFYKVRSLSDKNKIHATLTDGMSEFPFIIESKNLIYISRVDINEPLFYIFSDYLSTILYKKVYREDTVLISIEDVHIFSDYENLKNLADLLYENNIDFIIGFIPYVRQSNSKHISAFTESKKFIETLNYMQEKGGSIVLHTYVHNITEDEIGISRENTKELENLEGYFDKAVRDCVENGLLPIGYSSSHVYLTHEERAKAKELFSSTYGQVFINEGNYIVYPFELYETPNFNKLFPINLGYVNSESEDEFDMIDSWLDKISIVDGYYAGVYFHSSTDELYMQKLIDILKLRGIITAKPLDENHTVKTRFYNIELKDNQKIINKNTLETNNKMESVYTNLFFVITLILSFTLIIFSTILRKSIKSQKENMFKGR